MRKMAIVAAAVAGVLAVSSCGAGKDPLKNDSTEGGSNGKIIVGSANFPENSLIAEIYAGALNDAGVKAGTKLNIGQREVYIKAIKDGSIDLVPEYTGNLLQYLDKNATSTDPATVMKRLKKAVPNNLTVLDPSKAADQDSVTVTKETAKKYNLKTISDLKPVASKLVLGGPPEWAKRKTGVPGLKKVYGLHFKDFKPLDTAGPETVTALKNGQVQAANLFTTDPQVAKNGFVVLKDDKHLFLPGNVVPLVNKKKATPKVKKVLDEVNKKLTTHELTALTKKVQLDKLDSKKVAGDWLAKNGLGG
ncbi:ABC transporter substrate-binding protein [Spelaeicoccus albus]|uniref:Osmoprotectant transport system substrate-binding protein n=1 Tax=Spelaeicoccus albus TaxID=1280376 RepID=A0A7Z0CZG7_9MICO|nr:ABC transporter substrate-binding protein [Spelaeicoccus albus]NYI66264.1 osmoprotectant transport system substrate-binding protein [Spelaeicoccus albus]